MFSYARLLAALEDIRDPRRGQGKRYTLPHMLLFAVLAVLAGAASYQSIITFISLHRERLNQTYGARFRRAPALNTLRNLILALAQPIWRLPFGATRVVCTTGLLGRACARSPWTGRPCG